MTISEVRDMPELSEIDYPLTCKATSLFEITSSVTVFLDKEAGLFDRIREFYGRRPNELIQEFLYRGMFEMKNFMEQALESEKKDLEREAPVRFAVVDVVTDRHGTAQEFTDDCGSREEAIEKAKEAIAHLTPQERKKRKIFPAEIDKDGNIWKIEEVSE
jgi:hypothetical protein